MRDGVDLSHVDAGDRFRNPRGGDAQGTGRISQGEPELPYEVLPIAPATAGPGAPAADAPRLRAGGSYAPRVGGGSAHATWRPARDLARDSGAPLPLRQSGLGRLDPSGSDAVG
jgi:hypothetical protein